MRALLTTTITILTDGPMDDIDVIKDQLDQYLEDFQSHLDVTDLDDDCPVITVGEVTQTEEDN